MEKLSLEQALGRVGPGWATLVRTAFELLHEYDIVTVKEKFGGLRVYTDTPMTNQLFIECTNLEDASFTICEQCGAPGQLRERRWRKTLCDDCAVQRG